MIPTTDNIAVKTTSVLEWHPQEEKILAHWSEQATSYRYLHDRAYKAYKTKNMCFTLPVIILSTIAGTANFSQGTFPEEFRQMVAISTGFLNLTAGLITTISHFLQVGELMEMHRSSSVEFGKLGRNIAVELSLPTQERTDSGRDFVQRCRVELDRLYEKAPSIPMVHLHHFRERFQGKSFRKPDIMDIQNVEIFLHQDTMCLPSCANGDDPSAQTPRPIRAPPKRPDATVDTEVKER